MKIGVWGAYKDGFITDDILFDALETTIKYCRPDAEVYALPNGGNGEDMDFILIGPGSMLGHPLENFNYSKPFGVFGTGWRDDIALEKLKGAKFVYVRGPYAKKKLVEKGIGSEVIGDPVCLVDYQRRTSTCQTGMIPRNVPFIQDWLFQYKADMGIVLNVRDDGFMPLPAQFYTHPNTGLEALLAISFCERLISARCHPYFAALLMGIPSIVAQFEFNKVWEVMDGFGIRDILKGSVYDIANPVKCEFPDGRQIEEAQSRILEVRHAMKRTLCQILP